MPFQLPQRPEGAETEFTRFVNVCELHPEWPEEMRNWNFYHAFFFAFKYNYIIAHNAPETIQMSQMIASIASSNTERYLNDEPTRKIWVKLLCGGEFVRGYEYADQKEVQGVGNFIRDLTNCIQKSVKTITSRQEES